MLPRPGISWIEVPVLRERSWGRSYDWMERSMGQAVQVYLSNMNACLVSEALGLEENNWRPKAKG